MLVEQHIRTGRSPRRPSDDSAFLAAEGPCHFLADWVDPVFINFRIEPDRLQPHVPYELDLRDDSAWVSLVAFTMRDLRPAIGGALTRLPFLPFREQRFLNVRTYVKAGDQRGIHFIAEWISDWVNARIGPLIYGLPYQYGHLGYRSGPDRMAGTVMSSGGRLIFQGRMTGEKPSCVEPDSIADFLLERYVAFNSLGRRQRCFRVWHEPWRQMSLEVEVVCDSLPANTFSWWQDACYHSANCSPGALDVRMGRPRRVAPDQVRQPIVSKRLAQSD